MIELRASRSKKIFGENSSPDSNSCLKKSNLKLYRLEQLSGMPIPGQFYQQFVVVLISTGEASFTMGYRSYAGQKGRLFVFHPGCLSAMQLKNCKGWLMQFDEQKYVQYTSSHNPEDHQGLFDDNSDQFFLDLSKIKTDRLRDLFRSLKINIGQVSERKEFHGILKLIIDSSKQSFPLIPRRSWTEVKIEEFEQLLIRYYKEQRNTCYYSLKLGLSDRRLNGIVSKQYGKTVRSLIQEKIATNVLLHLLETETSIPMITEEFGFCDQSHFYSFCKKNFGLGPAKIRAQFHAAGSLHGDFEEKGTSLAMVALQPNFPLMSSDNLCT